MRVRVLFLVNGTPEGAMGIRTAQLTARLGECIECRVQHRSSNRILSIFAMLLGALRWRPDLCYVVDMGYSGVLAAAAWRGITGRKVVVDTGDAISALMSLTGNRGRLGLLLTRWLENLALGISDHLVTRSHTHRDLLAHRVACISVVPDGVDTLQFGGWKAPVPDSQSPLRVGLLGSIVWNPRQEMCYGWELLEALALLRDEPVEAVIIGDGSGLEFLKSKCEEYGLAARVTFLGRLPYEQLPPILSSFDVCISTQTDDAAGRVRTTGKLPLYLASGCFVLASDVGEAARVLPPEMRVAYQGTKDEAYPARLATRIRELVRRPDLLAARVKSTAIAAQHFDYDVLAARLRNVLLTTAGLAQQRNCKV